MRIPGSQLHEIETLLLSRRARSERGAQWSALNHLVGTFEIVEQWAQPVDIQAAALIHSIYQPNAAGISLYSVSDRAHVRRVVGDRAELLAYLFVATDLEGLLHICKSRLVDPRPTYDLLDILRGNSIEVRSDDVDAMRVLHMAVLAERNSCDSGAPAPWLSRASLIATCCPFPKPPPVFNECTAAVEYKKEVELLNVYGECFIDVQVPSPENFKQLKIAAEGVPWVAEPWVMLGLQELSIGAYSSAADCGTLAVDAILAWNTSWDKRLSPLGWLSLARFLQRIADSSEDEQHALSRDIREALVSTTGGPGALFSRLDALRLLGTVTTVESNDLGFSTDLEEDDVIESDFDELPPRFVDYISRFSERDKWPRMGMYPNLRAQPFWDPRDFSLARELEQHAREISEEFSDIDPSRLHPEAEPVKRVGSWDVFMLFALGKRSENCNLVPKTTKIIESSRAIRTHGGLIYFSRLAPGSRIEPHRGPTNLRLRCHLGISIPSDCSLTVHGIRRTWEEGLCLVFDDSFIHEASNGSLLERVVLVVDMWHPDLTDAEVALLQGFDEYISQAAAAQIKYRELNEAAQAASSGV